MIGHYERETLRVERARLLEKHGMHGLEQHEARRLDELNRLLSRDNLNRSLAKLPTDEQP